MIQKDELDSKVNQGWLKANMIFQVIAINENAAKEALEEHANKLDSDKRVRIFHKKFEKTIKIESQGERIKEAFSQICEIGLIAKTFEDLLQIIVEYGPSSVDLLEPKKIELPISEAQTILNTTSELMHRFAAAGLGGIVFIKGDKQ